MTAIHTHQAHTHHTRSPATRDARLAWWSLAGFVPAFALAFLVGEGLVSLFGYPVGGDEPAPWWAMLGAGLPALVVFVLPAVAAAHFGRRALAQGDARGRVPMIVALVVAVGFVGLNLVQGVAALLT